jgi:hypothetical protein
MIRWLFGLQNHPLYQGVAISASPLMKRLQR